ncbi:hypothetical protein [Streptomyces pimonensis]
MIVACDHARTAQADIALVSVPGHTLRAQRVVGVDQVLALLPDSTAAIRP